MVYNQGKIKVKYSYSRLNTYESCGWKYKLTYEDKHYLYTDSLAADLGTLIHYIEEQIAINIINHEKINYDKLKEDFININIPKSSPYDTKGGVYGIKYLKEKYFEDFYKVNELGQSYDTKTQDYLRTGIYRLEKMINENPSLEIKSVEQYFQIQFNHFILSGYIDRILYNKDTGEYSVVDIKTKDHPFRDEDLVTPLQLVIYSLALESMYGVDPNTVSCVYDLPLCNMRQKAGTKGFIERGKKKLNKIFSGIEDKNFTPKPSALCYWCAFSHTNPNQLPEGQNLCPYYSLWKPGGAIKAYEVANKWEGMDKHDEIMLKFCQKRKDIENFDFDF